jgi:hypothetical protein
MLAYSLASAWVCSLAACYQTGNNMKENAEDEKVPLFGSWGGWYLFVVLFLVFLIILFTLFTKYFG